MSAELLVIVPTRGRPENAARVVQAWKDTNAFTHARLLFAVDDDDPTLPRYAEVVTAADAPVTAETYGNWQPMVPKLNAAAVRHANSYTALGFAGDDHLPRSPGWAATYLHHLADLRVGIVHGDDGRWHGQLGTEWAMSAVIVQRLQKMVPARVDHLYCDNAIQRLGRDAECLRYLPEVLIEHMHPDVGKAETDASYRAVNSPMQYSRDRVGYQRWTRFARPADVAAVRVLRAQAAAAR